jgi:hypothetical protein
MHVQKSLIVLSVSLLISSHMLDAAPFVYSGVEIAGSAYFFVMDASLEKPVTGSPFNTGLSNDDFYCVAISSDNQTAYMGLHVAQNNLNALIAIDIATNNVVSNTTVPGFSSSMYPTAAIAINGTTAYITLSGTNYPIPVPPFTIEYAGGLVIMNVTNPASPTVSETISLPSGAGGDQIYLNGVAISSAHNYAYVTGYDSTSGESRLWYVNLSTFAAASITLAANSAPSGIAIDTATSTAYVTLNGANTVQAFDISSGTPNPTGYPIAVGTAPTGIVIDSNNAFAYVANTGSNDVSVIDLSNVSVTHISGIPDQSPSTENIAISSDNTMLYVGSYDNGSITPITIATKSVGVPISNVAGYALAITAGAVTPPTPSTPSAPTNVVGVRKNNVFLFQTARSLTITWTASVTPDVTSYNIYNGTTLVGNVLATSPLTFDAQLASGDNGNNYFVTAVNASGESTPVPVVVVA